jgi:hypothetical protein
MSEKNEFDYSTIDTCGVAVIVVLAVSALFAIFLIFAISQLQFQANNSNPEVAAQKAGDFHAKNSDTEELIFHNFVLNEAISNDW